MAIPTPSLNIVERLGLCSDVILPRKHQMQNKHLHNALVDVQMLVVLLLGQSLDWRRYHFGPHHSITNHCRS
jgi:hypothetical protein